MHLTRPTLAFAGLLLSPILLGCGADEAEPATAQPTLSTPEEVASSDPASSPFATGAPSVSPDGTVALTSLTDEQAQLHADVLLVEEVVKGATGDGYGGKTGTFVEGKAQDHQLAAPEGLAVADEYAIQWADGKLTEYTLSTESGEEMSWEAGAVFVEVAVDQPESAELATDAEKAESAIDDWIATYDEIPSAGGGFSDLTLEPGMFDDYQADEVEIELQTGIDSGGWSRVNDQYELELTAEATDETAVIDQDGLRFLRRHPVV